MDISDIIEKAKKQQGPLKVARERMAEIRKTIDMLSKELEELERQDTIGVIPDWEVELRNRIDAALQE